jgi:hypothetical protein
MPRVEVGRGHHGSATQRRVRRRAVPRPSTSCSTCCAQAPPTRQRPRPGSPCARRRRAAQRTTTPRSAGGAVPGAGPAAHPCHPCTHSHFRRTRRHRARHHRGRRTTSCAGVRAAGLGQRWPRSACRWCRSARRRALTHGAAPPSVADVPRLAAELIAEQFDKLPAAAEGCHAWWRPACSRSRPARAVGGRETRHPVRIRGLLSDLPARRRTTRRSRCRAGRCRRR